MTLEEVLDGIDRDLHSQVDDIIPGDHPDEVIVAYGDGDHWTIKVRKTREGEGVPQ